MAQLLITGGAGFIGSHTCLVLLEAGHNLVVLDDFSNSNPESLRRVLELANLPPGDGRLQVVEGDIRSDADLMRAFATSADRIEAVVHFAGLKAVGESVQDPLRYWDVNVAGSRCLLAAMQRQGCRTLVFSSSATLYGLPDRVPIAESAPIQPINPYGHTKAAVEQQLADLSASEAGWRIARLRYFNPVGAHPSGRIGEDPLGPPNNLFPFISQVAVGRRPELIWRTGTGPHCTHCWRSHRNCSPSTWAADTATRFWSWCRPSRPPAAGRCRTGWWRAARVMPPAQWPTPNWPPSALFGAPNAA
jgi:UDP-glucose 4-epimerase